MKKDLRSKLADKNISSKDIYAGMDKDKVEDVKRLYSQYADKDENELKDKLLTMAKQGKADGSLSDESIDAMAKKIAPMLSGEKKEKLNQLIAMMKNNQS